MHDLVSLVQKVGYPGLFLIIFLESFPLTFFLPGDSLLFTTGFLASQGFLDLHILIPTVFVAAILGYVFSYSVGQRIIRRFFTDPKARIFNPKHLEYTERFFAKYGAKTIIIGRFVPVVRSFSPSLAGMIQMKYNKFLQYTFVGGVFWAAGVTTAGFYLGKAIPRANEYITPLTIIIIIVSVIPALYEYYTKDRKKSAPSTPPSAVPPTPSNSTVDPK